MDVAYSLENGDRIDQITISPSDEGLIPTEIPGMGESSGGGLGSWWKKILNLIRGG